MVYRLVFIIVISLFMFQCKSGVNTTSNKMDVEVDRTVSNDTIRISNPESDYDIVIIEPGFFDWLITQQPKENYTQKFLEMRNAVFVQAWNQRALNPSLYDNKLYQMEINYFTNVDYGMEVNYKLFMYFRFFQSKYNQNLLQ